MELNLSGHKTYLVLTVSSLVIVFVGSTLLAKFVMFAGADKVEPLVWVGSIAIGFCGMCSWACILAIGNSNPTYHYGGIEDEIQKPL